LVVGVFVFLVVTRFGAGLVSLTELFIYRREAYLNKFFKVDDSAPANALARLRKQKDGSTKSMLQLERNAGLKQGLTMTNRSVGGLARLCSITIIANVVATATYVLGSGRSAGSSSALSLISATMLIGTRFLTAAVVCSEGLAVPGHECVSLYTLVRAVFNRLDEAADKRDIHASAESVRLKQMKLEGIAIMAVAGAEELLEMRTLPATKAAIVSGKKNVLSLLAACTGGVAQRGTDGGGEVGASEALPGGMAPASASSSDVEAGVNGRGGCLGLCRGKAEAVAEEEEEEEERMDAPAPPPADAAVVIETVRTD